jgi:hypothetical protein
MGEAQITPTKELLKLIEEKEVRHPFTSPQTKRDILTSCVVLVAALVLGALIADAGEPARSALAPIDLQKHAAFALRLSPDQAKALSARYPDFRILTLCSGRFSGADRDELVLGIWKRVEPTGQRKREVHRVGLLRQGNAWEVHSIDDEIEKDAAISRSFPLQWSYRFTQKGFSGGMKCGIESEFKDTTDLTYALGDKPFFDLKEQGLLANKAVCFATDTVYNNWDCVVYSPKDGRFRLWFQQAHAD